MRFPLVLFGFLVARLRRLPVVPHVLGHVWLVASGLLAAAALAFAVWAATIAPERVSLADLVAGKLSTMQTWIIISGDLASGPPGGAGLRYVLIDPAAPNARMYVISDAALPTGRVTISGTYVGGREPVPAGYPWIGTMRSDPELAPELGPPWGAIGLAACAVLLVAAAHAPYPVFVGRRPGSASLRAGSVPVTIGPGTPNDGEAGRPAVVELRPGGPVELRIDADREPLRLHSVHTGVDVGELRVVGGSEPALRIRRATNMLTLGFASVADRDRVYAAMVADEEGIPASGW